MGPGSCMQEGYREQNATIHFLSQRRCSMDYHELREVGKIWILMGVFSTCFFASCGQNPTSTPESATPVSHTKPVAHDITPQPVNFEGEYEPDEVYSEDYEGTGNDGLEADGLEGEIPEYTEDIPKPSDNAPQEVSSNTPRQPNTEVALDSTPGSAPEKESIPDSPDSTNTDNDASIIFLAEQGDEESDPTYDDTESDSGFDTNEALEDGDQA